jgi:transcriptional regulator with GAF, ATPase, and Fis domain
MCAWFPPRRAARKGNRRAALPRGPVLSPQRGAGGDPPLTERRDDIPALVDHFFARHANEQGIAPPGITSEAMAALQSYDWPGNVRQLRNVVERTIILTPRERLGGSRPTCCRPKSSAPGWAPTAARRR